MKTFIITIILSIGLANLTKGQSNERNNSESRKLKNFFRKEETIKPRAQMKHFDAIKIDKEKAKHNGTSASKEIHNRKKIKSKENNGFAIAKASAGRNRPLKAKRNSKAKRKSKKGRTYDSETYVTR